jgi:hypothetical protein
VANNQVSQSINLQVSDVGVLPNYTRAIGPLVFPATSVAMHDYLQLSGSPATYNTVFLQSTPLGTFYIRNLSTTPIQFAIVLAGVTLQANIPGGGIFFMASSDTKFGFGTFGSNLVFSQVTGTVFPIIVELLIAVA